ncbi:hypothetical protein DL93DRAFT_1333263 [Clavulina sp. PMI_390]|nr:hypothetical protein DL93DRAFT_1333263 [Clavulina sp. PMI_390]
MASARIYSIEQPVVPLGPPQDILRDLRSNEALHLDWEASLTAEQIRFARQNDRFIHLVIRFIPTLHEIKERICDFSRTYFGSITNDHNLVVSLLTIKVQTLGVWSSADVEHNNGYFEPSDQILKDHWEVLNRPRIVPTTVRPSFDSLVTAPLARYAEEHITNTAPSNTSATQTNVHDPFMFDSLPDGAPNRPVTIGEIFTYSSLLSSFRNNFLKYQGSSSFAINAALFTYFLFPILSVSDLQG